MTRPLDPKFNDPEYFRGKPDEYMAWAREHFKNTSQFCAKHWMPCPVEGKPGLLVSVILTSESFAFIPGDVTSPSAINSWMENQIIPVCCKLGDEKMNWLWWIVDDAIVNRLCRERSPERGFRVCWRQRKHDGEHEWERPLPRSVFDLMTELHP